MTYEIFAEEICRGVKEALNETHTVKLMNTMKLNDTRKVRLLIEKTHPEEGIYAEPSMGLDEFYDLYLAGKPLDVCVQEVLRFYQEAEERAEAESWYKAIHIWEQAKQRVYPILLCQSKNKELLQDLIWRPFLDLAVCYAVVFPTKNGQGTMKIRKSHLSMWGIDEEELHRKAEENNQKQGYSLMSIDTAIRQILTGKDPVSQKTMKDTGMYVLTNDLRDYGATKMLCSEYLKEISAGRSFYIIPSSVHELILLGEMPEQDQCIEELNQMIQEVNRDMVAEEEVLSDHVYFYNAKSGKIEM